MSILKRYFKYAGLAARTIRRSVAVRRFFMADCKGVQLLDSL